MRDFIEDYWPVLLLAVIFAFGHLLAGCVTINKNVTFNNSSKIESAYEANSETSVESDGKLDVPLFPGM